MTSRLLAEIISMIPSSAKSDSEKSSPFQTPRSRAYDCE